MSQLNNAYQKHIKQVRKEKGLCTICSQPNGNSKWRCDSCNLAYNAYNAKKRERKLKSGICLDCCSRPHVKGRQRCTECLEANNKLARVYARRFKLEVLNRYGGPICACCGEAEIMFLALDHVNNDGKAHRAVINTATNNFYNWLRQNNFPNDPPLQVLCWNCNRGKFVNGGVCPHKNKVGLRIGCDIEVSKPWHEDGSGNFLELTHVKSIKVE